ncbi:MAG TPA: GNAT family N-acetyltransferase [Candidatus Saccharimonadales bacterium]
MRTFEKFELQQDHAWTPQVVGYVNEIVEPAAPWGYEEVLSDLVNPKINLYGLAVDGRMTAFGALYGPYAAGLIMLEYLVVDPSVRGLGYGSAMLEELEHAAGRLGAHEMRVSPLSGPRVTNFYKNREYTWLQVDPDDPDSRWMAKELRNLGTARLRS